MTENILEGFMQSNQDLVAEIKSSDNQFDESTNTPVDEGISDEQKTALESVAEQQPENTNEVTAEHTNEVVEEPDIKDPTNADWAKARIAQKEERKRFDEERKSMQTQLDELRGQVQGTNNFNQQIEQQKADQLSQQKADADREAYLATKPDVYDENYADWMRQDIMKEVKSQYEPLIEQLSKQNEVSAQQTQINQARSELSAMESNYAKIDKDYNDAREFLLNSSINELKITNPNATDQQARDYVEEQFLYSASNAINQNQNPAQVFKQMAEARGFNTSNKSGSKAKVASQNRQNSVNMINKTGTTVRDRNSITMEEVPKMDMDTMLRFDKDLLKLARNS